MVFSLQEGTLYPEYLTAATLGGDDGSVILAGNTFGTWTGTSVYSSGTMFAAVKLDSDGAVLWRWQVGCKERRLGVPQFPSLIVVYNGRELIVPTVEGRSTIGVRAGANGRAAGRGGVAHGIDTVVGGN